MATDKQAVNVPISVGELIDKITILQIKRARINDAVKQVNIINELGALLDVMTSLDMPTGINELISHLRQTNEMLWGIEDEVRICERNGRFDSLFINLARSVYVQNDRRAAIKREINELTGSLFVEEKSYEPHR